MAEQVATEYQEQLVFIEWLELHNIKFTAIPNSTYTPSMKQKVMNRRMGLRAGLPDVLVALPTVGILFIELKRIKKGVVSKAQADWIDVLNACPGSQARVCYGAQEAITFVMEFLPAGTQWTDELLF